MTDFHVSRPCFALAPKIVVCSKQARRQDEDDTATAVLPSFTRAWKALSVREQRFSAVAADNKRCTKQGSSGGNAYGP